MKRNIQDVDQVEDSSGLSSHNFEAQYGKLMHVTVLAKL